MLWEYNKRNLNVFECILYNTILGFILWVVSGCIVPIQNYILQKFHNLPGLDLLFSLCPFFIFYWFLQVNAQKAKILGDYPKFLSVLTCGMTMIVLQLFFGSLKVSVI